MQTRYPHHLDPLTRLQVERGVRTLFTLGQRATVEFQLEVARRIGGLPAILDLLSEYERRLTPEMLHVTGANRSPLRLHAVPRDLGEDAP